METSDNPFTDNHLKNLREGIQNKYRQYHQTDRDRFPDFEYNTNRANYIPLRASFEEEFFVTQGLDHTANTIHIPSISTLASLFTNDSYVPSKKLLDTCLLYAESNAEIPVHQPASTPEKIEKATAKKPLKLLIGGFALLLCVGLVLVIGRQFFIPAPSGLVINRPAPNSTVPQELVVNGNVSNAETVWLAVRYKKGFHYWIQPPIKVQEDGSWLGVIYVGGASKDDVGLTYQIRAFVNPAKKLTVGEIHYSWPEAELNSAIVEVIKK